MLKVFKYEIDDAPDATQVARALAVLPPFRLQKALSYKRPLDRFLCAEAYILLRDGLKELYGIIGDPEFGFTENGKPFLAEHPDIHFNLSHCPRCVCCAISDRPVGIDVEEIQYDPDLAAAACSAAELAAIARCDRPEVEFTRLWTAKESYLKMTGEGLRDNMKSVLEYAPGAVFSTEYQIESGYILNVCQCR